MILSEEQFESFSKAAIAFANLPEIVKAADVEQLFPWIGLTLKDKEDAATTYTTEQQLLRSTLDSLIRIKGELDKASAWRTDVLWPLLKENGKPALHFAFGELMPGPNGFELYIPNEGTRGVKTAWLLLLDAALAPGENGRYLRSKRLRRCGWKDCPAPYFMLDKYTRPSEYHNKKNSPDGRDHRKQHELDERKR
jgi:hypothetical protein